MRNEREVEYDDILKRAMPFILFSDDSFREPLISRIGGLYIALDKNDTTYFDTLESQITAMIDDGRKRFDSHKENLIEHYHHRNKTYGEKFQEVFDRLSALEDKMRGSQKRKKTKSETPKIKTPIKVVVPSVASRNNEQKKQHEYYLAHKEKILKWHKDYRDAHRDEINAERRQKRKKQSMSQSRPESDKDV